MRGRGGAGGVERNMPQISGEQRNEKRKGRSQVEQRREETGEDVGIAETGWKKQRSIWITSLHLQHCDPKHVI